jgi:hypothetical protein
MVPRRAVIAAVLALAGVTAATVMLIGSGGSREGPSDAQPPGSTSTDGPERIQHLMMLLRDCIRGHGIPGYPGFVVGADGNPQPRPGAPRVPTSTEQACASMVGRLNAAISDERRHAGAELEPLDAFQALTEATERYPLVAIGEYHMMQEWHDFMGGLLRRPDFAANLDDIVVEFGNARYQAVADRFLLALQPVARSKLARIWRSTIGGGVYWDAPVYEQFFRTVRSVNWGLPRQSRIRVLLGDPPVDFSRIRTTADRHRLPAKGSRETFFASVVERKVLDEDRRALLIIGDDHLFRGEAANDDPRQANVGTLLTLRHPGQLFVVASLPFNVPGGEVVHRWVEQSLRSWPRPSLALLRGTWLGEQHVTYRALEPGLVYSDWADAVLWFGPESTLTSSQADPAIYASGAYAAELARRSRVLTRITGRPVDLVAEGLILSTAGPGLDEGRAKLARLDGRADRAPSGASLASPSGGTAEPRRAPAGVTTCTRPTS